MKIEIKLDGYHPVIIDTEAPKQTIEIPGYDEACLILNASELRGLQPGEGHDAVCVEYVHVDTDEDEGGDGDPQVSTLSGTLYAACEFGEIEGVRITSGLRKRLHAIREACVLWEIDQRARIAAEQR